MPRCYMVKKALCNKYITSVARGFESWGRGRSTPSPTTMQLPVSPIEGCVAPPVAQECLSTQQSKETAASDPLTSCERDTSRESPSNFSPGSPRTTSSMEMTTTAAGTMMTGAIISPCPPTAVTTSTSATVPATQEYPTTRMEATTSVITCATGTSLTIPQPMQPSVIVCNVEDPTTTMTTAGPLICSIDDQTSRSCQREPEEELVISTLHHRPPPGDPSPPSSTSTPYRLELVTAGSRVETRSRPISPCPPVNAHVSSMFKDRSAAETEAAHDLLELSRSLPPLPPPSVAIGPQSVIETPATDVQEMTVYQPAEQPIYQVNTIDLAGATTVYNHHPHHPHHQQHHQQQQPPPPTASIIYEPTIVQQTPGGVFIPLSPVQEILFTYSTPSIPCASIVAQSQPLQQSLQQPLQQPLQLQQEQSQPQPQPHHQQQQPIETTPPLTPPTSECSSDIENNNPNSQPSQRDKEVQTVTEQTEVKAASYTYDTLLVADGRSKNKKVPSAQKTPETEPVDPPETSKTGRYVCCECGKQYATSSNLSRHKQTHRSIDSQSAKKCIHCGKAYVSMPALAMHVLTHKLTHSCGVCGKMFSRPWLLQGHLRSHTGEKPYGCAHCGKAFADRSNLRAHMQTHSADKNYECPKCHKSFALKSYLNKHLESACQRENGDDSSNDVDSPP